jgi:hypothetical protein
MQFIIRWKQTKWDTGYFLILTNFLKREQQSY